MKAEIEKNKDSLHELNKYKNFMLDLIPPEFRDQRQADIKARREKLRKDWIRKVKKDTQLDPKQYHIIFNDDEEIHENYKANFSVLKEQTTTQTGFGAKERKSAIQKDWRAAIPDSEWERRFEDLMALHLIDVPDDYYDDALFFQEPSELHSIFNKLEEENLFSIS